MCLGQAHLHSPPVRVSSRRRKVRRAEMFIEYITLDHTRPCFAEPAKIVVVGKPSGPIDVVFPLLNAMLPNVISYNPRSSVLVLRRKPGFITLLADILFITQVKDADEGLALLEALRDLVNQTWERRDEIQPRNEERRTPRPLDVWQLLPRTNCRRCGEPTCMAFTFGLLEARRRVDDCSPLCDASASVPHATLLEMLGNYEVASSVWRMSD